MSNNRNKFIQLNKIYISVNAVNITAIEDVLNNIIYDPYIKIQIIADINMGDMLESTQSSITQAVQWTNIYKQKMIIEKIHSWMLQYEDNTNFPTNTKVNNITIKIIFIRDKNNKWIDKKKKLINKLYDKYNEQLYYKL